MAGNHVVLELTGGFVLLAHLRRGSVAVTSGDPFTAAVLSWRVTTMDRHVDGVWGSAPGPVPSVRQSLAVKAMTNLLVRV